MSADILHDARLYLVACLKGKRNGFETKHAWRKDWQFFVLHSLHVESYALKILAYEKHTLTGSEITLLRVAAILHDVARLDRRENHAQLGADLTAKWLEHHSHYGLRSDETARVLEMIADHSRKDVREQDFCKAVLKDADTLDEIGAMSIFMTGNWLDARSPFFFHQLQRRLIQFELPFCDKKLSILNTDGAKTILRQKKSFVENFIAQLTDELKADGDIAQMLPGLSRDGG